MVEIGDIKDEESLTAWLEGQSRQVSIWVVHRCAMRLLPEWWYYVLNSFVVEHADLSALPALQSNLISGFASKTLTSEAKYAATAAEVADDDEIMGDIIEAALAASIEAGAFSSTTHSELGTATNAARAADDAIKTINTAAYGVYAANAVADASLEFWALIESDCAAITAGDDLYSRPLWGDQNNPFEKKWKAVKGQLSVTTPSRTDETVMDWSFWIKWYDNALKGTPPNWKILERIALIDPKDWDKGAKTVNPMIADIVAEFEVEPKSDLTPQQALSQNAKAVVAQLEALKIFVEEEIQRIRGSNNVPDAEQEQINMRVVALQSIVDAIKKMITALADGDQSPENALVVIEEQLPKVIDEADKLAEREPEISKGIVVMAATVDYLTKRGVPGHVASGVAVADIVFQPIKKWFKRKKKSKS